MSPKVRVLTKDNCAYCVKAKQLLDKYELEYVEYDYNTNQEAVEEFEHVFGEVETLPQVVIDGELIGGYYALVIHLIDYQKVYRGAK